MNRLKDIHKGEIIWVLGSGPSMDRFPEDFFDDKIAIGVNLVYRRFSVDYNVARHKNRVVQLSELAIPLVYSEYACDGRGLNLNPKVKGYRFKHLVGSSPKNIRFDLMTDEMIINSSSTITSAMHLAANMGAAKIMVCGHDLKEVNGKLNFYNYNPISDPVKIARYKRVLKKAAYQTPKVIEYLKQRYGCEIEKYRHE